MAKIRVVIDWYRFSITIDKLIDIDWYRLVADFVTFQNLQADGMAHKYHIFLRSNCKHISF